MKVKIEKIVKSLVYPNILAFIMKNTLMSAFHWDVTWDYLFQIQSLHSTLSPCECEGKDFIDEINPLGDLKRPELQGPPSSLKNDKQTGFLLSVCSENWEEPVESSSCLIWCKHSN